MLGHVVVQQHPDGHHGCRARRHGGVHQDDLVVLDVLGQAEVVQLGLARVPVGLDQDLPDPDVLAHLHTSAQCVSTMSHNDILPRKAPVP